MDFTTIPVPSVKELVSKEALTIVPERYVIPDQDSFIPSSNTSSLPQVPVIDLSKLLSEDVKGSELEKLYYACKEWGFFQLVNHGVSTSVVENMKTCAKTLFDLPMEEKKKLWQREGGVEGFGQAFILSEEQKLEWGDAFFLLILPQHLRKSYLFDQFSQPFREILETYSAELKNLAIKLLELMAKALSIDPEEITHLFRFGTQTMRFNCYPPCPQPERVIGLKPHSDSGGLTILLQGNDIDGLQIRKDGQWIPIHALPNAFIINMGDILEMITNGIYRSIEHRSTVNSKERISIATFYGPNLDAIVVPAPSLVTPERPAQFRSISAAEYIKGYFSQELRGKSYLDEMRIQNE